MLKACLLILLLLAPVAMAEWSVEDLVAKIEVIEVHILFFPLGLFLQQKRTTKCCAYIPYIVLCCLLVCVCHRQHMKHETEFASVGVHV